MTDSLDSPNQQQADLDTLRRQAKQRFVGAAVLVLLAVIALPFVLDSQPRPLPASVVIDIPKMDAAPVTPAAPAPPAPATSTAPTAPTVPTMPAVPEAAPTKPIPPLAFAEAVRAQALLNGAPPKSKYIVQAGSYTDPEKLKAAAAKLERAGIAHYTQAAEARDGSPRTRLRLQGPFDSREEANSAAAKVAKLGVASIVLKP